MGGAALPEQKQILLGIPGTWKPRRPPLRAAPHRNTGPAPDSLAALPTLGEENALRWETRRRAFCQDTDTT